MNLETLKIIDCILIICIIILTWFTIANLMFLKIFNFCIFGIITIVLCLFGAFIEIEKNKKIIGDNN